MSTATAKVIAPSAPLTVSREVAAQQLGISLTKMDQLLRHGIIPFRRFGRRILIPQQALERLVHDIATAGDRD